MSNGLVTITVKEEDENFQETLNILEKKYFHNGGDPDAEVIINWNKREAKEDGWISIYATNSTISSAIEKESELCVILTKVLNFM